MKAALKDRPVSDFPRPEGVLQSSSPVPEASRVALGRLPSEEASAHTVRLRTPVAGALVSFPFEVEGQTTPGSRVRVVVTLEGGTRPVVVSHVWVSAGPDGAFRLVVDSPLRFTGARYEIAVTAYSPGGARATAAVAVTER